MNGLCIYLIGRSGSGKTTIADLLKTKINKIDNRIITLLDGDEVRQNISSGLGFGKKDRSINVRRIGYVSNIITNHKGIAIASNIAPYNEDRLYNRNLIENNGNKYVEIFIDATLDNCITRDPKGLYKINNEKIIQSYNEFEHPTKSDLIINTNNETKNDSVYNILKYLKNNNIINDITGK